MNTTMPNPSRTLSTPLGLLEQIKTAQSQAELDDLLSKSRGYRNASSKTINRWAKAYTARKAQLQSL